MIGRIRRDPGDSVALLRAALPRSPAAPAWLLKRSPLEENDDCEADPMLKQALTMAERTFGRQSGETAGVLHDVAVFYKYTGRFEKASRLLADALTIAENADGPDHPQVATILHSIAVLDLLRGR